MYQIAGTSVTAVTTYRPYGYRSC